MELDIIDECGLCQEPLVDMYPLVVVMSGVMVPMSRDQRFAIFRPDDPNEVPEAVTEIFHLHCLETRMTAIDWCNDSGECQCERPLRAGDLAYQVQRAKVDEATGYLVLLEADNASTVLCASCVWDAVGDGDEEEGRLLMEVLSR